MDVVARSEHVERAPGAVRWSLVASDVLDDKSAASVVHKLRIVVHVGMQSTVVNFHPRKVCTCNLVDVTEVCEVLPGLVMDVTGRLVANAIINIPPKLHLLGSGVSSQLIQIREERDVHIDLSGRRVERRAARGLDCVAVACLPPVVDSRMLVPEVH